MVVPIKVHLFFAVLTRPRVVECASPGNQSKLTAVRKSWNYLLPSFRELMIALGSFFRRFDFIFGAKLGPCWEPFPLFWRFGSTTLLRLGWSIWTHWRFGSTTLLRLGWSIWTQVRLHATHHHDSIHCTARKLEGNSIVHKRWSAREGVHLGSREVRCRWFDRWHICGTMIISS